MTPLRVVAGMPLGEARGGAERLLATLARRGPEAGVEVHVVFLQDGPLRRELELAGVATSLVEIGRFRELRSGLAGTRRLARLLRDTRPDVVLSWLPRAHVYLAPAAVLTGLRRRLVWWQHHTVEGEEGLIRAVTALPAQRIVCTSAAVAKRQAAVRPRRPLTVCPPGIEPPPVTGPERIAEVRARLGAPADAVLVGIVGRLVRWKGQDRFVESVALLRERGLPVFGVVVGAESHGLDAGFAGEVRARARELGLDGAVAFTGHLDEPLEVVRALDVLVNASEGEPFGMTLAEAQAVGTPVVAVDAAGPREITADGRAGVLTPDGSPAALTAGIERLLRDSALREAIVAAGHERFEAQYTAQAFVRRAAAALREVASGPG